MSREAMRAIFKDDVEKFNSLVEADLDVLAITEKEKWNFLHRALVSITMKPTPQMIKRLIELDVGVNAVDSYGNTPLHYAARLKDVDIMKVLLDAGAEVNHLNFDKISPLRHMLLSRPTDLEAFELLLSSGADLEYCSDGGISDKEYVNTIAHGEDAQLLNVLEKYS